MKYCGVCNRLRLTVLCENCNRQFCISCRSGGMCWNCHINATSRIMRVENGKAGTNPGSH